MTFIHSFICSYQLNVWYVLHISIKQRSYLLQLNLVIFCHFWEMFFVPLYIILPFVFVLIYTFMSVRLIFYFSSSFICMVLNSLPCAEVPLRSWLTHSLSVYTSKHTFITCSIGKKVRSNCIAVHGTSSHSYRVSLAIWDHTVLPATRHKWTHPAFTPASQAGTRFTYPGWMEGFFLA